MAKTYRAALIGCSRMGAFIDNEVTKNHAIRLPYSHAAGYEACERTDLVAGADLREDVLERFGARYNVESDHWYTNYRDLIAQEQPDIVSIATQPEQRCEIILHAIEQGVRALYVEKPLCASVAEAEAIRDAVKANNVAFNMGTNRRYHNGYAAMRAKIESGNFGNLRSVISFSTGNFFNTSSHFFDVLVYLNGDVPPQWVQGYVFKFDELVVGSEVLDDPAAPASSGFRTTYSATPWTVPGAPSLRLSAPAALSQVTTTGMEFRTRTHDRDESEDAPSLVFDNTSSTLNLVEDLVHALDTGEPTRGGAEVAYWNTQIIFGFIESHRRGGARVELPLKDHDLRFIRRDHVARQPKYQPG